MLYFHLHFLYHKFEQLFLIYYSLSLFLSYNANGSGYFCHFVFFHFLSFLLCFYFTHIYYQYLFPLSSIFYFLNEKECPKRSKTRTNRSVPFVQVSCFFLHYSTTSILHSFPLNANTIFVILLNPLSRKLLS